MKYFRYTLDDLEKSANRKLFTYISFFAGGGGSSAGYKLAGGDCKFVNEFQQVAVDTYLANWPNTPHICDDIKNISGKQIMEMTGIQEGELDILDASPPCPPFSMSGTKQKGWGKEKTAYGMKQKNIEDLTWEVIRIAGEIKPKVIICENVKGLTMEYAKEHLQRMVNDFEAQGYSTVYKVLKGHEQGVPQKRERIFLVAIRKDLSRFVNFKYPAKFPKIFTLRDALKKGALFNNDVPRSEGQLYPQRKKEILSQVPQGGYWRDLPDNLQREYMRGSYFLGGGKTGLARRLSWDEPSLTLTCAPAQKQTERCHPDETRPLTFREYARIQTFPDEWKFCGSLSSIYKQIGNAVPVNLAYAVGRSLVNLLNEIENYEIQNSNLKKFNFNELKAS